MFNRRKPTRRTAEQIRVFELEGEIETLKRVIAVKDVEIQQLASVVARDRARVEAESAAYVRQRAESEGKNGRNF